MSWVERQPSRVVFFSQGRTPDEPSFLWDGGELIDPDRRAAAFIEITRSRPWRSLARRGPLELLCAAERVAGVAMTLGLQVETSTRDHGGRPLSLEGLHSDLWRVPTPSGAAAFLDVALKALAASRREYDADQVDAARHDLLADWEQLEWPTALDMGTSALRRLDRLYRRLCRRGDGPETP